MGMLDYLRFVFALAFVLGLIGVLYLLARQYGARRLGGLGMGRMGPGGRLTVVEVRPLDARRRLILVRRDEVEHLVLLGHDRDTVIETGIPVKPAFDRTLAAIDPPERSR